MILCHFINRMLCLVFMYREKLCKLQKKKKKHDRKTPETQKNDITLKVIDA
jgi:hypothetical protein